MAGELLQSLLKAQYKLNEDPYGISAGLIGAAAPSLINPYGSTGSNAAYTIGAGLLAGVLQGLGEKNVEEQNNALLAAATKALNSSGADRQRIFEENPRLNPFSAALTTDEIQRQRDALQKQAEADIEQKKFEKQKLYESNLARGIAEGQEPFDPAKEEARKTKLVEEAKRNLGITPDDARKLEVDYTKELTTGNTAQSVQQVSVYGKNAIDALKEQNPLRATTAIYSFAKLLDSKGVVRSEDGKMIADPGGPLGELASIHNQIMEKGKIYPEAAQRMRELVPMLVGNQYAVYKTLVDTTLGAAGKQGANIGNIGYFPEPTFEQQQEQNVQNLAKSPPPGMSFQQFQAWKRANQ